VPRISHDILLSRLASLLVTASLIICCGGSENAKEAEQVEGKAIANAKHKKAEEACLAGAAHMVECKTAIARRIRLGFASGIDTLRKASEHEKAMAEPVEAICEGKSKADVSRMLSCYEGDCEAYANCLIQLDSEPTLAKAGEIPVCGEGDLAYETIRDLTRTVWCTHPDGTPHGPWVVWQASQKHREALMVDGVQEGDWLDGDGKAVPSRSGAAISAVQFDVGEVLSEIMDVDTARARILKKYMASVKRCYAQGSADKPKSGKVSITMAVAATGRVTEANVSGFDSALDRCIQMGALRWRFSAPKLESKLDTAKLQVFLDIAATPTKAP